MRRGLDVIEKAATGGAETVRRIQKFARLRPEEAFVGLDLEQVIRDALAITRPRWEEKRLKAGVPLELELDLGTVPVVMGRPAELNEVVTNLILNAIDAMPHGGTLRLRTRSHGERHVVLTVKDTGIGMTEEVRKRIFDPFFTTKGEEGTGLGLSVSYSIVKRHGGEMRGRQSAGRREHLHGHPAGGDGGGPRAAGDATSPSPSGRAASSSWTTTRRSWTSWDRCCRTPVTTSSPSPSGAEALRVFAPGQFDLVVTNIGMVGMNGWELADHLRARDADVPLVFITGWGMQEQDQARCRGLGIFALLFKPVRPAELHATVQSALAELTPRA